MEQLYCKIKFDYVKVWFKSPLFPAVDNCVRIKVIDPGVWKKNVLLCLCTICQHTRSCRHCLNHSLLCHTWHNIGHKVPYISTGQDGPPVHLAPCLKPSRPRGGARWRWGEMDRPGKSKKCCTDVSITISLEWNSSWVRLSISNK